MKLLLLLIITALASGCTMFRADSARLSRPVVDFEVRTLDNPRLKEFIESNLQREIAPWPPASWDRTMLTLAALYYHPDLDTARARWAEAKAAVATASRRPNPTADSRYQYVSNPEPGKSPSIIDSSLLFPIEAPGKRRNRIAQAEHLSEAARLTIERTAWQVRSRVLSSVISLNEAMQSEALLRQQMALQEENDALIERRLASGEFSPLEATRGRISLGESRLALSQGQKQLADARVQLASALCVPATALEDITICFDFPENQAPNLSRGDLQRRALRGRPDIMAALAEYAAGQSALMLELAARFPDIQLGPGFEWDQGSDKWGISASLPLPVFDRNQGPVAESRARLEEAAARFTALQAQVIGEIDQALSAYTAACRELEAAGGLLGEQERQLTFLQAMTRPGEVQRVALFNAWQQRNTAALSRLTAYVKVQRARAQLADAVQEPLDPSEAPLHAPEVNPRHRGGH